MTTNKKLVTVDECLADIAQFDLGKIYASAEKRWNNGGKEIYEALQSNPEFIHSPEYKKYMEGLKKDSK